MVLERCNQVLLGYMSVCQLFFLSDRRNVLVRGKQIKVGDLSQMGVTMSVYDRHEGSANHADVLGDSSGE